MTKRNRIKTAARIEAVQTQTEAAEQIRTIGDLQRERSRLEATMNDSIAELKEQYAKEAAPINAEIEELSLSVQGFCEANRAHLTNGNKVKSADFVTGIIKWRQKPPSVKVTGVAAVTEFMKERTDLLRFIRTKDEINKEAILNEADKFDEGQVPGIKIAQGVEEFVIEPGDQTLEVA